jgi:hypothetical protein
MGSNRINDIILKISKGCTFDDLVIEYPITEALFKKLGGAIDVKKIGINTDFLKYITGEDNLETQTPSDEEIDKDLLFGSLLGDASAYRTKGVYKDTYTYHVSHFFGELGYIKLKYELLKNIVSGLTLNKPSFKDTLDDYHVTIRCKSIPFFEKLYSYFYTEYYGDNNPKKNIIKDNFVELLNWRSFAFWLMDDGKKYGSAIGVFAVSIGKQPYYTYKIVKRFTSLLSDKLEIPLYASEEKTLYQIHNKVESADIVKRKLAPLLLPHFAYKIGVSEESCGESYKSLPWFINWDKIKKNIEHPYIQDHPVEEYRSSTDLEFKRRYEKYFFTRVRVRGFPYYNYDEIELKKLWQSLKRYKATESSDILTASPRSNTFPNAFMNHRFKVIVDGSSPYKTFFSNKDLMRVLGYQLRSKCRIENTNVRNCLGYYGSQIAGQFNPSYARFFIQKYCTGTEVLDPCAGWGGRLCGALLEGKNYYGIEPCLETHRMLVNLYWWIKERDTIISTAQIIKSVAEDPKSYSNKMYDMAITSPPYFDKEKYSDEDSQSYIRYSTYDKWKEYFLKTLIDNVYNHLKHGAVFVLNVADFNEYSLVLDSILLAKDSGFYLEKVYKAKGYKTTNNFSKMNETFLVLRKDFHAK